MTYYFGEEAVTHKKDSENLGINSWLARMAEKKWEPKANPGGKGKGNYKELET